MSMNRIAANAATGAFAERAAAAARASNSVAHEAREP